MSGDAWITLAVVAGTLMVLSRSRQSASVVIMCAVVILLVTNVIGPAQAFSGFSNPAPVTVAALFVLAAGVEKTGGLQPIVAALMGSPAGRGRLVARVITPVAAASAFLNNTPLVAMLTPQVSAWSDRHRLPRSRLLIPLSYASILGGMVTLIGTSSNVVVSGLLEASGRPPIGMFELTPIGLPLAVAGLLLIVVLAPFLLPDRRSPESIAEDEVREFVVGMRIVPGGSLSGATVEQAGLRQLRGLFLVEIDRPGGVIAPVTPLTRLEDGDLLTFIGRASDVVDIQNRRGLQSAELRNVLKFQAPGHTFVEAVIGETSPLVGRTLKAAQFRSRYQAAAVAIHRAGQRVHAKLGDVTLKVGDTLLLLTDPGFPGRWQNRTDFLLVSHLGGAPPLASRTARWVAAIMLGIVLGAATGVLPILHGALLGVMALLWFGIMTPGEIRSAVNVDVVVVIAAAFGLAAAIEGSGLTVRLADAVMDVFGGMGPAGALTGIVLLTVVLTELVTNNAAVVLVFPVALSAAAQVGAEPRSFALAVALAGSASFLTPIGYQTNTMVYGAGGYRFGDFARLGAPLTLLIVTGIILIVSLLY